MKPLSAIAAGLLAIMLPPARLSAAESPPSVLVSTVMPRQGTLPERITAYGVARPALDAATTISQQVDGQVAVITVTPGEVVRTGEKLLDFRPSPTAISLYRQAVTALEAARATRARTAQLLAGRLATRDQLAQADKAVTDAAASLDALRLQGGGDAKTTVTAPFDGIVETVPVAQGVRVAPGTPLLTLIARNGLVVTVGIDPADIHRIRADETAELTRLSGGESLAGRVMRVDGVLNPLTRMVDADISVPPSEVLSGEAFAAHIQVRLLEGWLVPHAAVLSDASGAWVFQVAEAHGVRVGVAVEANNGDTDLVTGNIEPGHALVVDGAWQLTDGMPVRTGKAL